MTIPLKLVDQGRLLSPSLAGQHPRRGRVRVRVYLSVPGSEIAIREAFDAADPRLEDYVRLRRRSSTSAKRRPGRRASGS
jgi:hypothetical protein